MKFAIKTLSFPGAPEGIHQQGKAEVQQQLNIEIVSPTNDFQILLFLTGGSEAEAIQYLKKDTFQLLLAPGNDNAYASASEVKAYSVQHGYRNKLFCLDDQNDRSLLTNYLEVIFALNKLKGQRLGLIGNESEWLVASGIEDKLMLEKLGIELLRIAWDEIEDYKILEADKAFLNKFGSASRFNIAEASQVHALITKVISKHQLDAVTVECFPLVRENGVTACLSLSLLNDLGIPAGCEGDLCSITGMMISRQLFDEIPWMANLAGSQGNKMLLAHCTAPTYILDSYKINTHFETGKGTAIQGHFQMKEVSLFRLNSSLDKMFCALGTLSEGEFRENACRTQMYVQLEKDKMLELKNRPLGNHHLVLSGNKIRKLQILADIISLD